MHRVQRHTDIGVAVIGEQGVAAVGVARAAREVAAGDIDLDAVAGAQRVMDVRKADGQRVHAIGFEALRIG